MVKQSGSGNEVCKGGTLTDQLNALSDDRNFTAELAADFMTQKREASCIKAAKVTHDGSIEFL